jgi:hypothetical protein
MSSLNSAPLLILNLKPSRLLILAIGVCHLLALISLYYCQLPSAWITVALAVGICTSCTFNLNRYGNRHSRWFIQQIYQTTEGNWILYTATGTAYAARLISSYRHSACVILCFSGTGLAPRSVIIPPDAADPGALRRLRVYLHTRPSAELP